MDLSLEIRKLPVNLKSELVAILELHESWKKLMAIIPKTLSFNDYRCDIACDNAAKYCTEHFYLIEKHAAVTHRSCSEILLREWGTSGRVRPALGHLKHLLEKAELYRAADFVTVNILKQLPPNRPRKGPSAPVVMKSEELRQMETRQIEKILDEIDYPSSAIANINKMNTINTNINYSTNDKAAPIPKIVISESPDTEDFPAPSFNVPLVVQNERVQSDSDLIQFSESTDNNVVLPQLSSLLSNTSSCRSESGPNIPQLSSLLSRETDSEPNLNIPNISDLSLGVDGTNSTIEPSTNLPAFSQLIENSETNTVSTKNSSETNTVSTKNSRSCSSPLPNLSLNTLLPHFTYTELEAATNNFDGTPLNQNGRFLGSGAFGTVYLAEGLLPKPVAVKKLLLDNVEEVHIDDTVTKQFRNEVEVLSKYKHENLLSLLGYSCDGCTYCLLYEFIPGGALKDRLQKRELIWTERIYIALGTAKAIAYLHTAYATPLIHRDVKTANILLDGINKPKLSDFGLIKLSPSQNTNTGTTIFGTSAYMAPEAFRGDISIKLDTFSFGVVLLELLTSLSPVDENREGVDLVTHVEDHCEDEITPLLDTSVGNWEANGINFAHALYDVARKCLEEKKNRPRMVDVSRELVELVQKSA